MSDRDHTTNTKVSGPDYAGLEREHNGRGPCRSVPVPRRVNTGSTTGAQPAPAAASAAGGGLRPWAGLRFKPKVDPGGSNSAEAMCVCDDRRMARPTLLIVDDHEDFRRSARDAARARGFRRRRCRRRRPVSPVRRRGAPPRHRAAGRPASRHGRIRGGSASAGQTGANACGPHLEPRPQRVRLRADRGACTRLSRQERALRRRSPCARRLRSVGADSPRSRSA